MLADDPPVLADYDAIRIGMHLDRTLDRTSRHRRPCSLSGGVRAVH
jgi:hypothetical protein